MREYLNADAEQYLKRGLQLNLNQLFSKGFSDGDGMNQLFVTHGDVAKNCRVNFGVTYKRLGNKLLKKFEGQAVRGIELFHEFALLIVGDKLFSSVDHGENFVEMGIINGDLDSNCYVASYGDFAMIINKGGKPQKFDYVEQILSDLIVEEGQVSLDLETIGSIDLNPYWNYNLTYIDGLRRGVMCFNDRLKFSSPLTEADSIMRSGGNPSTDFGFNAIFNFFYPGDTFQIFKDKVIGFEESMGKYYTFLDNCILRSDGFEVVEEQIDTGLTDGNGQPVLFDSAKILFENKVLTKHYGAASGKGIDSFGNSVFFVSSDNRFMSIGFIEGVDEPEVAYIDLEIEETLKNSIHKDQTNCIVLHSPRDSSVYFFVRSKANETASNDLCYRYDLREGTFFENTGLNVISVKRYKGRVYIGTTEGEFILMGEGENDAGKPIEFERTTTHISLGDGHRVLELDGFILTGYIDNFNEIEVKLELDGQFIDLGRNENFMIRQSNVNTIVSSRSGLFRFVKYITIGKLHQKARYFKFHFKSTSPNGNFGLVSLLPMFRPISIEHSIDHFDKEKI